jgi:hypothetical protein
LGCVAGVAACSSQDAGTLEIVTGAETDTFTRDPAAVKLEVDAVDSAGNKTSLATTALPATTIDLGKLDETLIYTFQITATDAANERVAYGQSVPFELGVLQGVTVPIFVQRTGDLARMPGPLPDARHAPLLAIFEGRYLLVAGGSDPALAMQTQIYDFASFAALPSPPVLTLAPTSDALFGTVALFIDSGGNGQFYDFSSSTPSTATPPAGHAFADVAGGATVVATDGTQYIVGATRSTGAPTDAVLFIDATGALTWETLYAPRLGAAATWIAGRGLVVAGGNPTAPGVEVVSTGATTGTAFSYPADDTTGAGATALDTEHILLAGGLTGAGDDPGVRSVDLTCTQQCAAVAWPALPAALASAQLFASDATDALAIGDDGAATTHVYVLSPAAPVTELDTRIPLSGARAVVSPVGSVVLFGGASTLESFVP